MDSQAGQGGGWAKFEAPSVEGTIAVRPPLPSPLAPSPTTSSDHLPPPLRATGQQRICVRCIMDTSDPAIEFDTEGVCNHCRHVRDLWQAGRSRAFSPEELDLLLSRIRREGHDKKYDCVIGVSGGVDSTYVACVAKDLGLRPLAVHFDNGWNSELAVGNIEKTLKRLDIDLYTYVIDWEEFRSLHLAFLRASVPDVEIPTDHGIAATLMKVARAHGVRHILSGSNFNTEAILPMSYGYDVMDWRYIRSINRQFGTMPLKTFPHYGLATRLYYIFIAHMQSIPILNYLSYNKQAAMERIQRDLGWRPYGGKHHESIFTRFYQAYILPRKFGIDKRRAHLSALILSGQMTRETALREIEKNPYPSRDLLKEDREYVIKKLRVSEEEFEAILALPVKTFASYPSYYPILKRAAWLKQKAKQWGILPKRVGI
jgi:N-acetyl sugar amidotransferase